MRRPRYIEEHIVFNFKQAELGAAVPEVCRKVGISNTTFYRF